MLNFSLLSRKTLSSTFFTLFLKLESSQGVQPVNGKAWSRHSILMSLFILLRFKMRMLELNHTTWTKQNVSWEKLMMALSQN